MDRFLSLVSQFRAATANATSSFEMKPAVLALARIQHAYVGDAYAMADAGMLPAPAAPARPAHPAWLARSEARLSAEDCAYIAQSLLTVDPERRGRLHVSCLFFCHPM